MVRGELPYKKFYLIPDAASLQLGAGDINVVSPTQQAVEQAKMAVKRKLELLPVRERSSKKTKLSLKKTIKRTPKKKKPQSKSKRSRVKTSNKLK